MYLERILALTTAAVVAICLGVGLMMMAFGPGRLTSDPATATAPAAPALDKGAARETIETLIATAPEYARFFARMRETFPADYEATIDEFSTRFASTKQEQSVDYYLSEAVRRLRQGRGVLAAKAEAAPLGRVFDKQLDVLKEVAKEDKRMCVAFLYGATNLDFQRFAAGRRVLVADMALAGVDAIANGQAKKIERTAPTEADFQALESALAARGLGKLEIDALLDGKMPDPPLEDAKMCAAGQIYFEVMRALPEAARMRIYGLALELMARS